MITLPSSHSLIFRFYEGEETADTLYTGAIIVPDDA
jgi:hypothetical protein